MLDAFFLSDVLSRLECLEGRGWNVLHFVAREEAAEMEWGGGEVVVGKPTAHLANHVHIVVDGWNDEVGDFYPYTCIAHGEDGVEDRLEMPATDALIDGVAERFEVNVGCIEVWEEVGKGGFADVTCCDEDVPKTCFVRQLGCINDVFKVGERLCISVGNAWTMVLLAEGHDGFGR